MEGFLLNLNSSVAKATNTGDYTTYYYPPRILDSSKKYYISMVEANLWYSYYNCSASAGNNKFTYSADSGATWNTITIPDGNYNVPDINDLILTGLTANGHNDTNSDGITSISIVPNFNTSHIAIVITEAGFQWDSDGTSSGNPSKLYSLFGFSDAQASVPITATTISAGIADITNGINKLVINCSLLSSGSSYDNGTSGNCIYSFIPNSRPGSVIAVKPNERIYLGINNSPINSVRMFITDQDGRPIDFHGDEVSYLLHVREV